LYNIIFYKHYYYKRITFYSARANNTKEMLGHPDFPLPSDIQESFIPRSMVLDYLENFANHFQLKQFIKVKTEPSVEIIAVMEKLFKVQVLHKCLTKEIKFSQEI